MYSNQAQAIPINKTINCSLCVCNHFLSQWENAYKNYENFTYGIYSAATYLL
ncbi:TPA: helix-turn-helix domain-containing protein [Bacillus thuringiensis]|nr:helix-turn-helix domain-containing protein [Bacillus thuringiensis]